MPKLIESPTLLDKIKYDYTVAGTAADNQTWVATGTVKGRFPTVFDAIMIEAFRKVTGGKAVYGKPGVGCAGPYQITAVTIEREED